MRWTPASRARATTVRLPLEVVACPVRSRSMAARMRARSSCCSVTPTPRRCGRWRREHRRGRGAVRRPRRVSGEHVPIVRPFANVPGVSVGADRVAAALLAGVLAGRVRVGVWVAERVAVLEDADEHRVGVVEQDETVAGEVLGGLLRVLGRNDAPFEAGCGGRSGESAAGGGAGDFLAGGEAV